MKIICMYNSGEAYSNEKMPTGFFETSEFNLELGKEFLVMGIVLYDKLIMYLIDENGKPSWYPHQLFKISDNAIKHIWYFKTLTKIENQNIEAIWGYYELCFQEGYYDELLEREENAIRIYFKRKIEFENSI